MRLVVQSDSHKEAVLQECHSDPGTGKHNGIRSTRNTVVSTYYWSTITEDVNDWVRQLPVDFFGILLFSAVLRERTCESKLLYASLSSLSSGITSYQCYTLTMILI